MQPDVVMILTDEERALPDYERDVVGPWRREHLVAQPWFEDHSVSFTRHYTGAVACVPSRPTLFTGQYPDVHGVTQTDGLGKMADDSRMRWLREGEVPTLGHWFRLAGYDTYYQGKWHLTHADLTDPATGGPLATNTADGDVLDGAVATYAQADALEPFGFSGWIGPEPHGGDPANAGVCRDPLTAERVAAWLADRYARRAAGDPEAQRPFLVVASFVNPHDIVLFPAWVNNSPLGADPHDTPVVPVAPSATEDLTSKPAVQRAYARDYLTAYGPAELVAPLYDDNLNHYRQLYHRLLAEVDAPVERVRRAVEEGLRSGGGLPAGTVVVRTSDHGELLGSHGGLHQKWFTLYDEAVRIPLYLVHLGNAGEPTHPPAHLDTPTSHVDLVPTLLDAAGIDRATGAGALAASFTEVHPLPGRSLWPAVRTQEPPAAQPVYLQTRDHILEGDEGLSAGARRFEVTDPTPELFISVPGTCPSNLEAIIARVTSDDLPGAGGHWYKAVRTFDDPATWTEPNERQLATFGADGVSWRTGALPEEWELYDLDDDPGEIHNLAASRPELLAVLSGWLDAERQRCLPPRHQPWPYASRQASALAPG